LQRKTQETYEILLNAVDDLCARAGVPANPTHVMTDFESSCIAAVRQVFGDDVTTHGCFYHLTQSTWRKIQVKYRPQQPYSYIFPIFLHSTDPVACQLSPQLYFVICDSR